MKNFLDIKILYKKSFRISKYYPISNSNINTVVIDMNNVELNSASDSSNEVFNINSIRNNSSNTENKSIGENSVNISNFPNNEFIYIYI